MKFKDIMEQMTTPSNIYLDTRVQKPFWFWGRAKPRELGNEKKDPRYDWKTWAKWRKKMKKLRKKKNER